MAGWQIRLFGRLRAERGDEVITRFGTQQTAGLVAYLAYHLGQWQAREELVELLWPGVAPDSGRGRLNTAVYSLRRILGAGGSSIDAVVGSTREAVRLEPGAVTTDVAEFRERATIDPEGALATCAGPLLAGLYQDWILPAREALGDELLQVARTVVTERLALGDGPRALAAARQAVAADPLREEAHLLVIQAALASGAEDQAQRQYAQLSALLERELGLRPSFTLAEVGVAARPRLDLAAAAAAPAARATVTLVAWHGTGRRDLAELAQAHAGRLDGAAVAVFGTAQRAFGYAGDLAAEGLAAALHTTDGSVEAGAALVREVAAATSSGAMVATEAAAALLRAEAREAVRVAGLGAYRVAGRLGGVNLFALAPPGAAARPEVVSLPRAAAGSLPVVLSRFFGRAEEQQTLLARLRAAERSLVTLTGPGGCGKTRLAIQVARQWLEDLQLPVWFVPLAPLSDSRQMARRALEVVLGEAAPSGEATERLVFELRRTPGLLVLDNLEHLPETAAGVVELWADRVPGLRCLVTSRHRLGVAAEEEYALEPLPHRPTGEALDDLLQTPAIGLFVDRARGALPTFALTARNAGPVRALCESLEGLPLALELAAARVGTLPLTALVAGLDQKLDWAAGRRSALPARQRTLRATLSWSHDLLPRTLRRFLARLSVFRGTFTAAQAAAVTGEPLAAEYLAQLRGYSLVVREADDEAVRWRLLAMVREFAWEQLGPREQAAAAERHARAFYAQAERLPASNAPAPVVAELAVNLDDFRAAARWGVAHDPAAALTAALALSPLWQGQGHWQEGSELLDELLRLAPADHPQRGPALLSLNAIAVQTWPTGRAHAVCQEALAWWRAHGDPTGLLQVLWSAAVLANDRGEREALDQLAAEGLAVAGQVPGVAARVLALDLQLMPGFSSARWAETLPLLRMARDLAAESGDELLHLVHETVLLATFVYSDLDDEAERLLARMAHVRHFERRDSWSCLFNVNTAAWYATRNRLAEAAELLAQMAPVWTAEITARTPPAMFCLLVVLHGLGDHAGVVAWYRYLLASMKQVEVKQIWYPTDQMLARIAAESRAALSPAAVRRAEELGDRLTAAEVADAMSALPRRVAEAGRAGR